MRIVTTFFLLCLGAFASLIAFVNKSGLPASHPIESSNLQLIPIIIFITNLVLAVYPIFKAENANPPPSKQPTFIRWVLIIIAAFIIFCDFTMFSASLFSPFLFGSNQPVPEIGVISSLIMALILSAILFFASRMNSTSYPNLFRYIALVVAFFAVSLTTVQCLMLIYAVPVQPPTAYPLLSGLLTIAYIPFSVLVLMLSKSYVAVK